MADGEHASLKKRSFLREPLLYFVVIGLLIFAAARLTETDRADEDARAPIVVTAHLRETLAEDRFRRVGERPAGDDLDALVAGYVREEALYREALRLGLDRGDTIVRRRLVQKMEFVLAGAAEVAEPTDAQLEAYLEAHSRAFRAPPRVAFEHVYLSRDARGDTVAADAAALVTALVTEPESAASRGDPFIAGSRFALSTEDEIAARMGFEFGAAVTAMPVDRWSGPVESSFGLHAVRVTAREDGGAPDVAAIRPALRRAYLEKARIEEAEEAIRAIVARYPTTQSAP
jgi:hypothetical protein